MQQLSKRSHTPAGASPGLKKLDVAGLKLLLVIAITVTTCYSLLSSPRGGIAAQSPRGGIAAQLPRSMQQHLLQSTCSNWQKLLSQAPRTSNNLMLVQQMLTPHSLGLT
jgi:hypothetical protein